MSFSEIIKGCLLEMHYFYLVMSLLSLKILNSFIALSLSYCLQSPHLQPVLECSESNLEQPFLQIPFFHNLHTKGYVKDAYELLIHQRNCIAFKNGYTFESHRLRLSASPKESPTVSCSHCIGSSGISLQPELLS